MFHQKITNVLGKIPVAWTYPQRGVFYLFTGCSYTLLQVGVIGNPFTLRFSVTLWGSVSNPTDTVCVFVSLYFIVYNHFYTALPSLGTRDNHPYSLQHRRHLFSYCQRVFNLYLDGTLGRKGAGVCLCLLNLRPRIFLHTCEYKHCRKQ